MTDAWEGEGGAHPLGEALQKENPQPSGVLNSFECTHNPCTCVRIEDTLNPAGWRERDPAEVPVHSQRGLTAYSVPKPDEGLGQVSTRDLLLELQLRGDLAMTVWPTTPRGQDGSFLSATAGLLLRGCNDEATLNAIRGS